MLALEISEVSLIFGGVAEAEGVADCCEGGEEKEGPESDAEGGVLARRSGFERRLGSRQTEAE